MRVAENLARIREAIGDHPIKLIAVTKNVGLESMQEAMHSGVTEFGENRVQEALDKQAAFTPERGKINWHLIGHLQTNKVKKVVGRFSLIHSIDSLRLAEEISKAANQLSIVQPVLVQVKILEDPGKSGFSVSDLKAGFDRLVALDGIRIEGLMTIAPLSADPLVWKDCFTGLRLLRDELSRQFGMELKELSMGMSQDWKEAINCGATMIRLGRAIFSDSAH